MTRQVLVLDGFPTPRQVRLLGPNGTTASPFTVAQVGEALQDRVKLETMLQQTRPVPPPAVVTLRYVFAQRRERDMDNFARIGKPIIDGLVRSGILAGDDAARLTERVEIVAERGAQRRLEVIIEGRLV